MKGHIPGGQHDLRVHGLGDALYQISMGTPVDIKSLPDGNIPGLKKSVTVIGKDVPKIGAIEAGGEDIHDLDKDIRVHIVEFLKERGHLPNKLSSLLTHVHLHGVVQL